MTDERWKWFHAARFGMFIHWGAYSVAARGEWVMNRERIPLDEYTRLYVDNFHAERFQPEEWVALAKEAGMKYMVLTTRHHDGFCLWDTALTDKKVTHTPFRRDIIGELAPALQARGLKLHFYYSLMDWTHPAYRNDWPTYLAYLTGQLRELLTRYGPVGGVLFDGYWPCHPFGEKDAYFKGGGPLQPCRHLRPDSHAVARCRRDQQPLYPAAQGRRLPGVGTRHTRREHHRLELHRNRAVVPRAVWWNLNHGWGYQPGNHRLKSAETIHGTLERARQWQATFLPNIGPRPFGDVHPDEAATLRQIGTRLRAAVS